MKPAETLKPHRSVVLVASATALSLLGDQALYAVLPIYYEQLQLGKFEVGVLLGANRFARLLTNHVAEVLTRRWRPTAVLVLALLLGAALTACYGLLPIFWTMLAARILWGLCWSCIRQVGVMTAVDTAAEKNVGRIIGYHGGLARLGSSLGMLGGAALFAWRGFHEAFIILAGISLLSLVPGAVARRGLHQHESTFHGPGSRRRNTHVLGLLICGFCMSCVGAGVIMSSLGYVLKRQVGDALSIGGAVISIAVVNGAMLASRHIINVLGAPALGALQDHIGHRRGAAIFFFVAAVIMCAAAITPGTVALLSLVVAFFVCSTGLNVVLMAESGRFGSKSFAAYASAADLGAAVGPILAWTLFSFIASPAVAFAAGAVLLSVGTVAAVIRLYGEREEG